MKYSFSAIIDKAGINPFVDVPLKITAGMTAVKGYIPIKGKIQTHTFIQTLVPVKNAAYRLFVNGTMLKGANAKVGDIVKFIIEQDAAARTVPMPAKFKQALTKHKLSGEFEKLSPSRQKEILKYMGFLKTTTSLTRNIDKVITQLKNNNFPLR